MRFSTLFLGLGLAGVSSVLASTNEQTAMSGSGWFSAPGKKWEWKLCDDDEGIVTVESIDISPDPPQPGKEMTVTVNGANSKVIEEGAYADVNVKIGLIKLLSKRFDICEEARSNNVTIQCPVADGKHLISHTVDLPKQIPKAQFKVDIDARTVDDDDLMCLNLVIDFRTRPW